MLPSMRLTSRLGLRLVRWNSTAGPTLPPLMTALRTDLKTAMRAKDTPRLNVLRALISETNNAAKTNSPIQTDLQLLSLIRKRISASKDAAKEFESENRPDLKETEDRHIAILEEYGAQVETMSVDDIKTIVAEELAKLKETGKKVEVGFLLKSLFSSGGALDGKPAERSEVARIAKEAVSSA
ncbi:uncharacterized protein BO88DRAFT_344483 [Aspergillus vadensis CBS 113365]|uniref:Altered inheritance of mitochondria protein 41 n=1 Tax=Aspergillus vadensis (strain CBS 113365 / IMI 142717 / IBT 24658) TaxID=1448311 RepID=A0A319BW66_ASPVC|nr:GatB/YqeY domain-containing protein [Aspergillus vadensis CBS 113365]PYH67378.1 GatB/YqeY domain-containing protein [Aspergillus vadensis CBS 113365]